jgi:hypothetical protein
MIAAIKAAPPTVGSGAGSCSHNKTPGQDPGAELILDRASAQKQNGRNWVRQAA